MSPMRWFVVVLFIASPVSVGAAFWALSSHSITPAAVAGALVVGAAFGRPGSVTRQGGRVVSKRAGYDYALLAMGAAYVGVVAGIIAYTTH